MDSLITAAARALALGDPLGALNRVALRDDARRSRLRGIAMAQLGDLDRAKALLRRAARAFGPRRGRRPRAMRRRRGRDRARFARPRLAREGARQRRRRRSNAKATGRTPPMRAISRSRRLLLIGRLDDAERDARRARSRRSAACAACRYASSRVPGSPCGASMPGRHRRRSPAPRRPRAGRASRLLAAEVDQAFAVLEAPAARLIARGGERPLLLDEVEALLRVEDACRRRLPQSSCASGTCSCRSHGVRCCSRLRARSARHGPATCRGTCCLLARSARGTPTNPTARGCASRSGGSAGCSGQSPV